MVLTSEILYQPLKPFFRLYNNHYEVYNCTQQFKRLKINDEQIQIIARFGTNDI